MMYCLVLVLEFVGKESPIEVGFEASAVLARDVDPLLKSGVEKEGKSVSGDDDGTDRNPIKKSEKQRHRIRTKTEIRKSQSKSAIHV